MSFLSSRMPGRAILAAMRAQALPRSSQVSELGLEERLGADVATDFTVYRRDFASPRPHPDPEQREHQTYDTHDHQHEPDDLKIDAAHSGGHRISQNRTNRDQKKRAPESHRGVGMPRMRPFQPWDFCSSR